MIFETKKHKEERLRQMERMRQEILERQKEDEEEIRRKAEPDYHRVMEFVEQYKKDEGIMDLADSFFQRDFVRGTSPFLWVYGFLDRYVKGFSEDSKQNEKAYLRYNKDGLSFLREDDHWDYSVEFKDFGFAPIEDINKLEAVAIVVLDTIVEKALKLAEQKGCTISIIYEMNHYIYEYWRSIYADYATFGVVGDENYLKGIEYSQERSYERDPREGDKRRGAIISIANSSERCLRSL